MSTVIAVVALSQTRFEDEEEPRRGRVPGATAAGRRIASSLCHAAVSSC